jgi:small-conductance mechanosensitive channel
MQEFLQDIGSLAPETRDRLVNTVLLLLVLWAGRWAALRLVARLIEQPEQRYGWRKGVTYAVAVLGVLLVGRIWSPALSQLGTFLGLVTAALAIALREPVTNLAGWMFILWRRPFRIGDRIQIGPHVGDVVDIRLFQFSLMEIGNWVGGDQPTGRIIHLPNGQVFTLPQANYDSVFPFIWNELPVLVTFESDWRRAKTILLEIAARHALSADEVRSRLESTSYAIARMAGAPAVITTVADSGVQLTIRYLCNTRQRRSSAEAIWEEVLARFGECDDVDFAYPTTRFYANVHEGKSGARAELPSSSERIP